jgi:Mycothiol maleylpyruvate isomerase N-terminal domain
VERVEVLDLYEAGVSAVEQSVASFTDGEWQRRACGAWTATDLAGHLICVAGWYHAWLDRAEAGDATPPFTAAELAERNDAALSTLEPGRGDERVAVFAREARRYAERLNSTWALPFGFPLGTVTAGLHAGVAAIEWHLHAWDFSGGAYRPTNPRELFLAAGAAVTAAQQGPVGRVSSAMMPLASRRKPWEQLLKRSGRTP